MVVLNIDLDELARRQELARTRVPKPGARIGADGGESELADALAAARRGNPDALQFLYDQYSAPIYAFLLRITRNEHEAEDLTQAVLMRLYSKVHLYRADAAPF